MSARPGVTAGHCGVVVTRHRKRAATGKAPHTTRTGRQGCVHLAVRGGMSADCAYA